MKWGLLLMLLHFHEVESSSTGVCDNIEADIKYGPSAVLANLTDPSIYDSQKRPNSAYIPGKVTTDDPDDVYIALSINSIIELDEIKQTLTTSLIEEVTWTDLRLKWDPTKEARCVPIVGYDEEDNAIPLEPKQFEGRDKLIWTPSTDIINVVSREYGKSFAITHPDASAHRFEQQEITTTCPMKFGQYPFDKHVCYFDVSTFQHSDQDVSLHPGVGYPVINNKTELLDISLLTTDRIGQFVISMQTATSSYQGAEYTMRGELYFERSGDIFAVDIMLPDILLHISIYASFWVPSDSPPARVSLCIISALSFRILRSSISAKLPPVSYAIWVVDYMAASQAIAVLALIQFAFVCYFLSFENVHDKLFRQFEKSKIPMLIKRNPSRAVILFKEAKLQYEEFCEQANMAVDRKSGPARRKKAQPILSLMTGAKVGDEDTLGAVGKAPTEAEELDIKSEESIDLALSSIDNGGKGGFDGSFGGGGGGGGDDDGEGEKDDFFPPTFSNILKVVQAKHVKVPEAETAKSRAISMLKQNVFHVPRIRRRESIAFDQLNFNLTTTEVMVIAHVRAAFKTYDEDHNGVLRIAELQKCFRHFGKFYSCSQVCSIIAAYRQTQGSTLGQHPTINLADFFCILVEIEDHEPLDEFIISDWFAISPSHLVDLAARFAYPVIVIAKIMIFFMILQYYTD